MNTKEDYYKRLQECIDMARCMAKAHRENKPEAAEYYYRRMTQKIEYLADIFGTLKEDYK